MRQKIKSITQWLRLPTVCVLCGDYHHGTFAVCTECQLFFAPINNPCRYCSLPLANADFLVCGQCIKKPPYFDSVISYYRFEEPLRTLLHDFKYKKALYLRSFLAQLMINAFQSKIFKPDCLVPIPLHPQRLRERGFNQAAELAKLLAKQLNFPCNTRLCQKIINTPPQVGLNHKQRRKNLRHSFTVRANNYQHIILIDDLLTTGSTANEVARILKQQGVKRVDLWCCARTSSD